MQNFHNKDISLVLGFIIFIALVYQNCAPHNFTVGNNELSSQVAPTCTDGESLACESSNSVGVRLCHILADGSEAATACVPTQCKAPFVSEATASGMICVSPQCQNGQTMSCTIGTATGVRVCQNNQWEVPCHWVKLSVNDFNRIQVAGANLYTVKVEVSDPSVLVDPAKIQLEKKTGSCTGSSLYKPWTVDGTSGGSLFKLGSTSWSYTNALASSLGDCTWVAQAPATYMGIRLSSTVEILAQLPIPPTTTTTTSMPPTTITTLPTTSTSLPPTTTTTSMPPTTTTTSSSTTTSVPPTTTTWAPTPTTTSTIPEIFIWRDTGLNVACAGTPLGQTGERCFSKGAIARGGQLERNICRALKCQP